jgi:hypothetical protein
VTIAGASVELTRAGKKTAKELAWPARPGLLVEARERLLVLTPLDAGTGEVGAPVELELRFTPSASSAFVLRTESALARLDLVLPGEAGPPDLRALRELGVGKAEDGTRLRKRFRLRPLAGEGEGR